LNSPHEICFFVGWIRQVVCWFADQMCSATRANTNNRQHRLLPCNITEGRPGKLGTCSGNYIAYAEVCTKKKTKKKLHGLSPRANYTDRATAACRRSDCLLFADRGCHVVSVTDPYGRVLGFPDRSHYFSMK
jgi:hypothetical protein